MSRTIILTCIILTCVALIGCPITASAQPLPLPLPPIIDMQGSPEDRAACYPDVQRFCRNALPDTFRVLGCLQANRQRISAACRAVLTRNGQ